MKLTKEEFVTANSKDLTKIQESLAKLQKIIATKKDGKKCLTANGEEIEPKEEECGEIEQIYVVLSDVASYLDQRINDLRGIMWDIDDRAWEHASKGHLPPITASQLNKLLKVAGADGDYIAEPKTIYAKASLTASKNEYVIEMGK